MFANGGGVGVYLRTERGSEIRSQVHVGLIMAGVNRALLPRSHSGNTRQYRRFSDLPAESAAHPFDVTGDSVGRDAQRRRYCILQSVRR